MKDWVWTTNFSEELKVMWRTFPTRASSSGAPSHGMRKRERTLCRTSNQSDRKTSQSRHQADEIVTNRRHQTLMGVLAEVYYGFDALLNPKFTTLGEENRCTVGSS